MRERARLLRLLLGVGICFALASDSAATPGRLIPRALFLGKGIKEVSVSPSGDWVVAVGSLDGTWGILVQRRGDGIKIPVYSSKSAIASVSWVGANTLFVEHSISGEVKAVALCFDWNGHTVLHDQLVVRKRGHLVDPLTEEDGLVLWARTKGQVATVERRSIDSLGHRWKFSGDRHVGQTEVVAEMRRRVERWITDADGVVRAAFVVEGTTEPEASIHYRAGRRGRWKEIWRGEAFHDRTLRPLAMNAEGNRLIVAAHGGRDTLGLYEFDPKAREFGDVIFQRPGVDVVDIRFDYSGTEIIAAVYHEGGDERFFYLDDFRDAHLQQIDALGLGRSVMVTGSSRDYRFLTLFIRSGRNPGSFYFFDKQAGTLTELGDVNLEVRPEWLAPTEMLRVEREDGTQLEVFLTRLPPEDGRPSPVLVLPHGGPIGVRDDRSFDPVTQFVASAGIAVLKVNYRGSGGYGRAFEEAGWQQWGEGIEDDVDAAVEAVVDAGFVDPERMCIAGMSYGGYSALMSAIRSRDRYRCVATIAGVTDIPLMFISSDWAHRDFWRKKMADIVGDPETNYEQLVSISPAYRVAELEAPVLIIHGTRDTRVDPDHARRLRAMLALHGKPYEWFEIPDAGHWFDRTQLHRVAWLLRRFVQQHLGREADVRGIR